MSSGFAEQLIITIAIASTMLFMGFTIADSFAADMEDVDWEEEEVEVVGPGYDYGFFKVLLVVLAIPLILAAATPLMNTVSSSPSQPDPVDQYKEQYVNGRLTLEEFEDKVYRVVEVDE